MERLSFLLHGVAREMLITGGEPLLNPQINSIVASARKHFSDTKISIVSNGILLSKMPKSFWNACRDNCITISVTRYPLSFAYDNLPMMAEKYGVNFEFFGIAVEKTTFNFAFDPTGRQNAYESFVNCFMANFCINLYDGKLATCSPILHIDRLNCAFSLNMKLCTDDYIDIYKAKDGQEIMTFLSKPIPFCRYCDVKRRTYDNPWSTTKRKIDEWIVIK
jgi:hypothetical protein